MSALYRCHGSIAERQYRFCRNAEYHNLYNKRTLGVSDMALSALMSYKWPGNIRELENMIERGVILTDNNHTIDMDSFFPSLSEPSHPLNVINMRGELNRAPATETATNPPAETPAQLLKEGFSLEQLEHQLIREAMEQSGGNISAAARLLGMTRPQLAYRLKKIEE